MDMNYKKATFPSSFLPLAQERERGNEGWMDEGVALINFVKNRKLLSHR